MGSNNIIVKDYLESLKEDSELDYLFPILLNLMGFRIVATARESKGQNQYGKDIVAVGKDANGQLSRYYFELKGYSAKDITDANYSTKDGIRESITEAKDAAFKDSSIPQFNTLPIIIVVVHNGTLKANVRPVFEGFIAREFPNGGFERWDIYHLTDLFEKHLFSESLLTDKESVRLFKRALVLLDAPDNSFVDFKMLVDMQLKNFITLHGRALKKLFATLHLLSAIIFHYSKENNNLHPARECLSYLILKVWAWILKHNKEKSEPILQEFRKLLKTHYLVIEEYLKKTLPVAKLEHGLFSENGSFFEEIGYPIRCMDYLSCLIYYFRARMYWPSFITPPTKGKSRALYHHQKEILFTVINSNSATSRPLLDNHSIAIMNVCLFVMQNEFATDDDKEFVQHFLNDVLNNINMIKAMKGRFPEMHNNFSALVECCATGIRPEEYKDYSSLLIWMIFELLAVLESEDIYNSYKTEYAAVNHQLAMAKAPSEFEQILFEKNLQNDMVVEANLAIPEKLTDLVIKMKSKHHETISYKTDAAGFPYLRVLAHSYYNNEFLPNEWRALLTK